MKSSFRILALVALAGGLSASTSSAMSTEEMQSTRFISFGVGGGVSVPVKEAADAFKRGFNGQGFVRLNLRFLPVQPRVDFSISHFDVDDVKVGTTGTGQILAGVANLQMYIIPAGPIRPYIVAGVGAYNFKTELDSGANAGDVSETKFGVNGGAGLLIRFGKLLSAYAEGRVDNVFTEKGVIDTKQIQVVPVTFGVVF